MTNVIISVTEETYDICVYGHADKVNDGEGNILCAAVSILVQTLIQLVRDMEEAGMVMHSEQIADGRARIICKLVKHREKIAAALQVIETGFLLLQNSYGKNIVVVGDGKI